MSDHIPTEQRKTYTVPEAAAVLGIGRTAAYEAVRSGKIPTLRIGKRLLVPRAALERLLENPNAAGSGRDAVRLG